jgi:hypothetical protein
MGEQIAGRVFFMIYPVADIQPLILGIILLWAGGSKLFTSRAKEVATRSALSLLLSHHKHILFAYNLVGLLEICVGLALLLPPHSLWKSFVSTSLFLSFVVYLGFSRRFAPEKPCACLGGGETAISWMTITRSVVLTLLAVLTFARSSFWLSALLTNMWLVALIVIELIVIIALSPDLYRWNSPVPPTDTSDEQLGLDCVTARVPLTETVQQLETSAIFQSFAVYVQSKMLEHWRQGCWRFLRYGASFEGRDVTAIFAVPVLNEPERIRGAIVDEESESILLSIDHSSEFIQHH